MNYQRGIGAFIERVGIDSLDNADVLDVITAAFTAGVAYGLKEAVDGLPTDLPVFKEQAG